MVQFQIVCLFKMIAGYFHDCHSAALWSHSLGMFHTLSVAIGWRLSYLSTKRAQAFSFCFCILQAIRRPENEAIVLALDFKVKIISKLVQVTRSSTHGTDGFHLMYSNTVDHSTCNCEVTILHVAVILFPIEPQSISLKNFCNEIYCTEHS